eukprot:4542282-Alexandrium_andersonii.AAC.1
MSVPSRAPTTKYELALNSLQSSLRHLSIIATSFEQHWGNRLMVASAVRGRIPARRIGCRDHMMIDTIIN